MKSILKRTTSAAFFPRIRKWHKGTSVRVHMGWFLPLLVLALLALLWRLLNARLSDTYYDGFAYIMIAKSIASGHLATPYLSNGILHHYEPLYPAAIAFLSRFTHNFFHAARLVNVLAGALLIWPVYGFANDLFGRKSALFASALVVTHPMLVKLSSNSYSEPLFILFSTFGLWWCWRAIKTCQYRWAVLSGFMAGLSYLTRSQGLSVLAGIIFGLCIVQLIFRRQQWKRSLAIPIVAIASYATVTAPYHIYLANNNENSAPGGKVKQEFFKKNATFGEMDWFVWERSLNQDGSRLIWQDKAEKESALDFVLEHPAVYAKRVIRDFGTALRYVTKQKTMPFLLFALMTVQIGTFISRKEDLNLLLYFSCYGILIILGLALFTVIIDRYVSVVIPTFLILAGGGLEKIEQFIRSISSTPEIPPWLFRHLSFILVLVCLFSYPLGSVSRYASWEESVPDKYYMEVAEWLNIHLDPDEPEIIMATHPHVPTYAGDLFYMMPMGEIESVSQYAIHQKADYILAEEETLQWYDLDPEVIKRWMKGEVLPDNIEFIDSMSFGNDRKHFALYRVTSQHEDVGSPASGLLATIAGSNPAPENDGSISAIDKSKPSVILISLDTLRADHLGCYDYHRDTSPTIDLLAGAGVRFENVVSHSPKTGPSHMSMLTSLYPSEHRVHWDYESGRGIALAHCWQTLAEVLRQEGYATGAFTGGGQLAAECGFDRGFQYFDENLGSINRDKVLHMANWMEEQSKKSMPVFLFIHTYQIHDPYTPPYPYNKMFDSDYDGWIIGDRNELCGIAEGQDFDNIHKTFWRIPPDKYGDDVDPSLFTLRDIEYLKALYDGEIRYTDSILKLFLKHLDKRDLLRNSLIIITSDHGEEFGEHGGFLHKYLYSEILSVPLIMWNPNILPRGKIVSAPVQLLDLMPTVLDLLDITCPPQAHGASLTPLIQGQEIQARPFYSEEPWYLDKLHQGIRIGRYFLYNKGSDAELFDLIDDLNQQNDMAANSPDIVNELSREMTSIRDKITIVGSTEKDDTSVLSEERKEQLKALGYMD